MKRPIKCKVKLRGVKCNGIRNKNIFWNRMPMCAWCYTRLKNSSELREENGIK